MTVKEATELLCALIDRDRQIASMCSADEIWRLRRMAMVVLEESASKSLATDPKASDPDGVAFECYQRVKRHLGDSADPGGVWRATIAKVLRESGQ